MSASSIMDESLSFIPVSSLEESTDEQLNINYEIKIPSADNIIQPIEQSLSKSLLSQTIEDLKPSMKNSIQNKYPLTEKSKHERAAKVQMERKIKSEQIKKANETITHDAKVIKVYYYYTICNCYKSEKG